MAETTAKRSYKQTLNLPKTRFSMKANLVQNEPASQKRWDQIKLYQRLREARRADDPARRYAFHDGPPYANGSIHLGHLVNKVLKDLVVRSRSMIGLDVPYVPGWDCHGLPIEHRVVQDLGPKSRDMAPMQIRKRCRDAAEKFVKLQSKQMQRLLTLADYDDPYLTMDPAYEAATLEVFATLVERGLVYRGLKPVHWSIENRTALADAELEYYDRQDTSVYVTFDRVDAAGSLMIWTTTPWTLPANLAVAVHPAFDYGEYDIHGRSVVMACELAAKVLQKTDATPRRTFKGSELVGLEYRHPFIDRTGKVVAADYVTLEDGTGLVHTAPGHGVEDYQTGLRESLEIYCPVREDGTFDDTVPDWLRGKSVWEANELVCEHLRQSGHMFHEEQFTHSYPHDWRGKTPVIFRATEQWFVAVEKKFRLSDDPREMPALSLKERALSVVGFDWHNPVTELQRQLTEEAKQANHEAWLEGMEREQAGLRIKRASPETRAELTEKFKPFAAIEKRHPKVIFYPDWGRNRMRGMLESRPDWCISRQRAWGLPIPAFYPPLNEEGDPLLTPASVRAVAAIVRQHGSDAWFTLTPDDLLAEYDPEDDPAVRGNPRLHWALPQNRRPQHPITKSTDIFDVWFESGSSWHAVMRQRGLAKPEDDSAVTDLYLEGSDQHRGWFQLSLLPCLGVLGKPPFAAVLTHGFMVGKDGRKMSKSLGNTLEVEDLLKEFGADVCRWWVASLNTDNDIKVDHEFFRLAGEEYRKVRNTVRFLLSNLNDFDPTEHTTNDVPPTSLEAWGLGEYATLVRTVHEAYDRFAFRRATEALFTFCNETLSAVYLTAVKDRLYCDAADSSRRRRTQTALHAIASGLIRLLAPILPHTADEAWRALHGDDAETVHLETFADPPAVEPDPAWERVMAERERWLRAVEQARAERDIDNPLDIGLTVPRSDELERFDAVDLADLCAISRFALGDELVVHDLRDEPRCERSWKRDGTVKQRSDGGWLSDRDAAAVGVA